MSIINILILVLIIYFVLAIIGTLPAPRFGGQPNNLVWIILVVFLLIFLFRGSLGVRW